jgi:erythrin-vacuolar iron transport family protein
MKRFSDLTAQELLALAIGVEEEHARIYADYADGLRANYPNSAKVFEGMAAEENEHRRWLIEHYRRQFGEHILLIRRQDVQGFIQYKPLWMARPLVLDQVRQQAETIERETRIFYERAAARAQDAGTRKLLGDLAAAERGHESLAKKLSSELLNVDARSSEDATQQRMFVLQVVQPGLAGLMDGSVSSLAPIFAAAFATGNTWDTFLVGMAASVGAGVSMGFAEALSDDGTLTGRGHPYMRGGVTGLMTMIGGIGHTLPFLINDFWWATGLAFAVVAVELWAIAWIRARYMDTPFLRAAFEVVIGGTIVFAAGIFIGGLGGGG